MLSLRIHVEQHRRGFVWLPDLLPYLVKAVRIQDMTHFVPESAKCSASEVRENVPGIIEEVEAMPASPEEERVEVDSNAEPSIAPGVPDVDLELRWCCWRCGSSGWRGPDVPVSDFPKPVAPPDDFPRAKGKVSNRKMILVCHVLEMSWICV